MSAASLDSFEAQRAALARQRSELGVEKNPFTYHDNWTAWEAFKCCVGVVLLPLRLFFAMGFLMSMWVCCRLAILGLDESKPMGCFRRALLSPVPLFARGFLFSIGFFWITVKGRPCKRSEAPVVVVAPHSTFVDSFVLTSKMGMFSGIGKEEARKTPIFGTFFRAGQVIAVQRGSKEGRKNALLELQRRARSTEEQWPKLVVFPEGTCTNRTSLIQFKAGAFTAGMPVQPVALSWPFRNFDPSWTSSSPGRFKLILRLMTQFFNSATIEFMPVIVPSEEEKKDANLFAHNVRAAMAERLGLPTTEHSYESSFLSMAAAKGKFNPDDILSFDFDRVGKLMGVDLAEAKRMLRSFGADPEVKKTGKMDVVQFAKALQMPLTDPVREMFSLLDTEDQGVLDFRHFLVGLTFVSHNASLADGVDVLFEALDTEHQGKISQQQLQTVLGKVFKKVDKGLVKRLMGQADPDHTGFVDKEKFKAFCAKHPELLVIALQVKEQAKEKGRPLSVLRKNDLKDRELTVHPLKLKTISKEVAVHVPETPPASAHVAPAEPGEPTTEVRVPLN